jgi:lysophospholipid acyltransferase (LPLAT)-like uncharacterized protein
MQLPLPFTRARVEIGAPIYVPHDADNQAIGAKLGELQEALDAINRHGEKWRTIPA